MVTIMKEAYDLIHSNSQYNSIQLKWNKWNNYLVTWQTN